MTQKQILEAFRVVRMATPYHFQTWTHRRTKDLRTGVTGANNHLKNLLALGLIKPIEIYPKYEKPRRRATFYQLTDEGKQQAGTKERGRDRISAKMVEHESALIDILLAFHMLYKDYRVEIEYPEKGRKQDGAVNPDAVVKLKGLDSEYHFIVEMERCDTFADIRNEKIARYNKFDFSKLGLSKRTRVLIVYTNRYYNVFARPMEKNPDNHKVEQELDRLLDTMPKDIKSHFRFLPFHDFHILNQVIWRTPDGGYTKLIQ